MSITCQSAVISLDGCDQKMSDDLLGSAEELEKDWGGRLCAHVCVCLGVNGTAAPGVNKMTGSLEGAVK